MLVFGVIIFLCSIILIIYGGQLNNDLESQLESVLSSGTTNPGTPYQTIGFCMLVVGIVLVICGIVRYFKEESVTPSDNAQKSPDPLPQTFPCSVCGTALTTNAKFCKECGAAVKQPTCAVCGTQLEADAKFCIECGTPVKMEPTCVHCGATLTPEAKFCVTCGTPTQKTDTTA